MRKRMSPRADVMLAPNRGGAATVSSPTACSAAGVDNRVCIHDFAFAERSRRS
jgi:hypothetical protein